MRLEEGETRTWAGASVEGLRLESGAGVNKGVFSAGLMFTDWLGFDDIWEVSAVIAGRFGTGVCLCGMGVVLEDAWVSGITVPANSSSSSSSSLLSPSIIRERSLKKRQIPIKPYLTP